MKWLIVLFYILVFCFITVSNCIKVYKAKTTDFKIAFLIDVVLNAGVLYILADYLEILI